MTTTTSEHCCGVRFRAFMPLLGEERTERAARQSAVAITRVVRMTEGIG